MWREMRPLLSLRTYYPSFENPSWKSMLLVIKVLECIFQGSNFNVHWCFVIYFLREQFWKAILSEQFQYVPMFWNVFFEGAILRCISWRSNFNVLKCIFWGSNFERHFWVSSFTVLKCIFLREQFKCFEMYFLREQFWSVFFEGAIYLEFMAAG